MMRIQSRRGYTIVEILIVLAILAVLISVAVPGYLKSGKTASRNACISNLRQIAAAMEQWSVDNNIPTGTVLSSFQEDEVYNYIEGGKPACHSKGEYSLHTLGSNPLVTCSSEDEGHRLPD